MEHEKLLKRAIIDLMQPPNRDPRSSPLFYTAILYALKHVFSEDHDTAAVDGRNLFINPDFWIKALLCAAERVFVLAHECLHVAYFHLVDFALYNRKFFTPKEEFSLWNEAADYRINFDLVKAGYKMPSFGLYDKRFADKTTAQIYYILHDEYKKKPRILVPGDLIATPDDGTAQGQNDKKVLRGHITDIIIKAKLQAEMGGERFGNMPAEMQRLFGEAVNPRLPFEIILANYMNKYAADDFSYSRPNRRFMQSGFYLPSRRNPVLCNIGVAFDVSGSVTEKELNSFGTGLRMIQEQLMPEIITLMEFDTEIHGIREVSQDIRIQDIVFHGGGGTIITPVFEWINTNKPEVMLIFTDGEFHMPNMDVCSDIIWIIHDNPRFRTNKGKVIHYKL